MDCLNNVIGITRTTCECLQDQLPTGYTNSESGLFIDELPEAPISLQAVKSIADCGKDMAFILSNARTQAISEFKRELFRLMQGRFIQRSKPYTGMVGSMAYSNVLALPQQYAGVVLETRNFRGAAITINKVHVVMDTTASFDLLVYKAYSGNDAKELISTIPVQSVAGGIRENVLTTPLELALADDSGLYLQYYFVYQRTGFYPKDNVVSCGCGMKENDLHQFVSPRGVVGDDLAQLTRFSRTAQVNGIVLDVDARCGNDDIICRSYENEFIRVAMQWSILRKSVENLILGIMNSDEINRYTMAKREQMTHNAYRLQKKFNNDVQWIAENMDLSDNDCYICNDKNDTYQVTGIRL